MVNRALVLAGGGARGAYQVGMLQTLVEGKGLDFKIIRGVSVGALNAAVLAQAPVKGSSQNNLQKVLGTLHDLWTKDIEGNHSIYGERSGYSGLALGADSLYSVEPLERLVKKHVKVPKLQQSGRDFAIGTVSLVSGCYNEWKPKDTNFLQKLLASAAIPVVFPYVNIASEQDVVVDGGTRNISPLASAFKARPDEIYVLLTSRMVPDNGKLPDSTVPEHVYDQWDDNWLGTKVNGIHVLQRAIEILTDEIHLDDLRGAINWNKVISSINKVHDEAPEHLRPLFDQIKNTLGEVKKRPVKLFVIAPREWYGASNSALEFSPGLIRQAIEHGRMVAEDPTLWVWRE